MNAISPIPMADPGAPFAAVRSGARSMTLAHGQLIFVLAASAAYAAGQLLVGTGVLVAFLFAAAILFGLLAVLAGGGLKSALGCLNAVLIVKFLIFGMTIKLLFLADPVDATLRAPETTATVMALGFAGLLAGTYLQSRIACTSQLSMNRPISDAMLLSFAMVFAALTYFAYFAEMMRSAGGAGVQTGGWLGLARSVSALKTFSIIPPMLYLWRKNTRLWMTHPVVLGVLAWGTIVGIFSTSKEDAIEPLAFYLLVGFMRYGLRNIRLWSLVAAGLAYYSLIVFPYSQYVRHNGGREGSISQRAQVTRDTFVQMITDPNFRSTTAEKVSATGYFAEPSMAPFNRLAMVGEADRLIAASEQQGSFTGWETITWGFKLLTPSILLPDKPVFEAGNYLGHIVGEVNSSDTTTQISYGLMANFYNAFGLAGVFLGTTIFFGGFYYWIRVFLGDARWDGLPSTSGLWFIWVIATFEHSIAESAVSGMIASLSFPFVLGLLWLTAKGFSRFLPAGPFLA
jgi:hypothetical protein